ncbi:hypothetical protein QCA50_006668 [Cerrena zonata]|uniref:RING-type domain-containing protein n=1 Tax=Cerrena zonata TaxID=2478898 RepID=A0AAW0GK53_9APHY
MASPQPPVLSDHLPMNRDIPHISTLSEASSSSIPSLKRSASSSFDSLDDNTIRKRLKEDSMSELPPPEESQAVDGQVLADDLEQELQCGCCSALVYRPVIVTPCQHFFCGSCMVLWIRNGGTNCPACRGISIAVTPSRALQSMADILTRSAPWKARSANERMQADEVYRAGLALRIPTPRVASPEPTIPQNSNGNFTQPCPHCTAGNQFGWRCPHPIVDPEADPDNAWSLDNGTPPGHAFCGNCESLLAIQAPQTSKCDFCQVSFCGIAIPGRCSTSSLGSQHPHALSDLGDLIQCGELYEAFDYNTVEVDIMLDYLTAQQLTPRHIYKEIIAIILRSPRQFAPLFEADIFSDLYSVSPGVDADPSAPRNRICRMCAAEVLVWGLKLWWVQERKKGFLEPAILNRPDCAEGSECIRQKDQAHAKEFNHVFGSPEPMEPEQSNPAPAPVPVPVAGPSNSNTQQLPQLSELDLLPRRNSTSNIHRPSHLPPPRGISPEIDWPNNLPPILPAPDRMTFAEDDSLLLPVIRDPYGGNDNVGMDVGVHAGIMGGRSQHGSQSHLQLPPIQMSSQDQVDALL